MWDATATKDGAEICDWQSECIHDPVLSEAFARVNEELREQTGCSSPYLLRIGMIASGATREPLEIATGRKCHDKSTDGIMYWSAQEVREIDRSTDWDFVYGGEGDFYEVERCGYWSARLFWRTCVEHSLGIVFTF